MAQSSTFLSRKNVISLVGKQGSGKSTLGKKLARSLRTDFLETSDVVKEISGITKRSDLPATGKKTKAEPDWLAKEIAEKLSLIYELQHSEIAVLIGVREIEIHKYLLKQGMFIWAFEIVADSAVRYQRLRELDKVQSAHEFLEQELREKELGVQEVEEKAPFRVPTSPDTKPQLLVAAMIKRAKEKGCKI